MHWVYPEATTTWLTSDEKDKLMAELKSAYFAGLLDEGCINVLMRLNTIAGLATEYSCIGHDYTGKTSKDPCEGSLGHEREGYVKVRVSKKMGSIFDEVVIPGLWTENLLTYAEKEWQSAFDSAEQPVPRITFIIRFVPGNMDKIVGAIMKILREEEYRAIL